MRGWDKLGLAAIVAILAYILVQFLAAERDRLIPQSAKEPVLPRPVASAFERAFPSTRVDHAAPLGPTAKSNSERYRIDFIGPDNVPRTATYRADGVLLSVREQEDALEPKAKSLKEAKTAAKISESDWRKEASPPAKKWDD